MAALEPCPRCRAMRLAIVYFDADGHQVGGQVLCTECGPRHAVDVPATTPDLRQDLLERRAS